MPTGGGAAESGRTGELTAIGPEPGLLSVHGVTRGFCRLVLRLFFQFRRYHRESVPESGPVILACTHQSNLDPPVVGCAAKRPLAYLAKDTLFRRRLGAWYLRKLGSIPVDRTPERGAIEGLRISLRALEANRVLAFFPEGTRSPDGRVQRLQSGIALVAKRSGAPVVPVLVLGTFEAWPRGRRWPKRHPIAVWFGSPIQYVKKESYDSFLERLRAAWRDLARDAGAERIFADESQTGEAVESPSPSNED